jgi:hypothetical protein
MKKGEKPFSMNVCFALQNFGRTLKIENIVYIYDITKYCVFPQAFFNNLVRSMRRHCQACINANGGHTRY